MSRQGKHKDDKTLFGAYVTPEIKALAEMTSDKLGITFTDIIINGLYAEATRAGIMKNGEITAQYQQAHQLLTAMTRDKILKTKKGSK